MFEPEEVLGSPHRRSPRRAQTPSATAEPNTARAAAAPPQPSETQDNGKGIAYRKKVIIASIAFTTLLLIAAVVLGAGFGSGAFSSSSGSEPRAELSRTPAVTAKNSAIVAVNDEPVPAGEEEGSVEEAVWDDGTEDSVGVVDDATTTEEPTTTTSTTKTATRTRTTRKPILITTRKAVTTQPTTPKAAVPPVTAAPTPAPPAATPAPVVVTDAPAPPTAAPVTTEAATTTTTTTVAKTTAAPTTAAHTTTTTTPAPTQPPTEPPTVPPTAPPAAPTPPPAIRFAAPSFNFGSVAATARQGQCNRVNYRVGEQGGTDLQKGKWECAGLSNVVTSAIAQVPGRSEEFLFIERPIYSSQLGLHPLDPQSSELMDVHDIETGTYKEVFVWTDVFCGAYVQNSDGDVIIWNGNPGYQNFPMAPGLDRVRLYKTEWQAVIMDRQTKMPRWYPTALNLGDGSSLSIGGTSDPWGHWRQNNFERWMPYITGENENGEALSAEPQLIGLEEAFTSQCGDFYYPLAHELPTGDVFMYCDYSGIIFNPLNGQTRAWAPALPQEVDRTKRLFPFMGPGAELPVDLTKVRTEKRTVHEYVWFGGSKGEYNAFGDALDKSIKLKLTVDTNTNTYTFDPAWEVERMVDSTTRGARPIPRVMGLVVVLPNGKAILTGGGEKGQVGGVNDPVMVPMEWDPKKPAGQRYSALALTRVPRLYHASVAMMADGCLLLGGCDECEFKNALQGYDVFDMSKQFDPSPFGKAEFRLERFCPPDTFKPRPTIKSFSATKLIYGEELTVTFEVPQDAPDMNIAKVALQAPSANTHSATFSQKVVWVEILNNTVDRSNRQGVITVRMPETASYLPQGKFTLHLVAESDAFSVGEWIHLVKQK